MSFSGESPLIDKASARMPCRPVLRKLLHALLRTDADLRAFCIDYFTEVNSRFTDGMDRQSKVNLLLEIAEPTDVLDRLRQRFRGNRDALANITRHLEERETEQAQQAWALREEFERLYLAREQRRLGGQSTAELDQQIVVVKRAQRQVPQLQEGEILADRYRLLEVIGKGGFARVWQAYDRAAQRLVAIKVLHREHGEDPRRIDRFTRGARKLKGLEHSNIVRVLDGPDEYHGFHYFVMDYLPGGDLFRAVISGGISRTEALSAILHIGAALEYAQSHHLIHRDVKPQNILLDGRGGARLTDFDLVWAADTTGGTRTGFLGTHIYVAPEQAEDAKSVDARADIYSLAMTTLFVLHGHALPQRAVYQRALFIDELRCDEPIKVLLRQATAIDPDDRPDSVGAFCKMLSRSLAGHPSWPFQEGLSTEPNDDSDFISTLRSPPVAPSRFSPTLAEWPVEARPDPQPTLRKPAVRPLIAGVALLSMVGGSGALWWQNRQASAHAEAEAEAVKLLIDVEGDLAAQRWTDAIDKTNRILSIPGASRSSKEAAQGKHKRADAEARAGQLYQSFLSAVRNQDYDQALGLYRAIPRESVYRERARAPFEQIFSSFADKHLKAAEEARGQGRCEESDSHIQAVLSIDPKHDQALAIQGHPCGSNIAKPGDVREPSKPRWAKEAGKAASASLEKAPLSGATEAADAQPGQGQTKFAKGEGRSSDGAAERTPEMSAYPPPFPLDKFNRNQITLFLKELGSPSREIAQPTYRFISYYQQAFESYRNGDYAASLSSLNTADKSTHYPNTLISKGHTHLQMLNWKEAEEQYNRYLAIIKAPAPELLKELERAIALSRSLGAAIQLLQAHKYHEAFDKLDTECDPGLLPRVDISIGSLLLNLGRSAEARVAYERYLRTDTGAPASLRGSVQETLRGLPPRTKSAIGD